MFFLLAVSYGLGKHREVLLLSDVVTTRKVRRAHSV